MNVSGIDFDLRGADCLNQAERGFLARVATSGRGDARVEIALANRRHAWALHERFAAIDGSRIEWDGTNMQLGNRCFSAEIDTVTGSVSLFRDDETDGSLRLSMRAAVTTLLPSLGSIPLHAAAVDTDGSALVFCGRSGAGKSTLAATSPYPLLSDEMVSVSADTLLARGTSFWGDSVCKAPLGGEGVPLREIVLLEQSREFRLTRVKPTEAIRALVGVTLVPAGGALWRQVLPMLGGLVDGVKVWRMAWWKDLPPWELLREAGMCDRRDRPRAGSPDPAESFEIFARAHGSNRPDTVHCLRDHS